MASCLPFPSALQFPATANGASGKTGPGRCLDKRVTDRLYSAQTFVGWTRRREHIAKAPLTSACVLARTKGRGVRRREVGWSVIVCPDDQSPGWCVRFLGSSAVVSSR